MPNWKKVATSGSNASFNSLSLDNGAEITGSVNISGSLTVSGSIEGTDFNGVPLTTLGSSSLFLNASGSYTTPTLTPSDQAALIVERTTDLVITGTGTGSANSIAFDTTGVENYPDVLEHNNTNTDRIDVKTTGLHQIAISLNVENSSTQDETLQLELRVNGNIVKNINFIVSKTSEELTTRITAVELTAGTYVTFTIWQSTGTGDLTLKANTVGYILKAQGAVGATGATGSGANIIVQDEGITQGTVVDTIDFTGNSVSVTESGSKATVVIDPAWKPNSVPLGAVLVSGASFFVNGGAGVYLSLSGAADDAFFFNDSLSKSTNTYDGSDLALKIFCRLSSNGTTGDTVGLLLDYALIKAGDNSTTTVTNVAQVDYDVSTEVQDIDFSITLTTMTGVADADTIMISVTRNSTGAGADTYGGNLEITGLEFIKM